MQENEWSTNEDWRLAEVAGHGDEDAYGTLIARHQNAVHRFIFRSVGEEEMARDLTQEVFVRAWFALPTVRKKAKFTTWLFQIAANLCRDHAKSKSTRQQRMTHSLVKESEDASGRERELVHPGTSPRRALENVELMKILDEEIRRLPTELLQPFLLGAVENYPYKEVSVMLGLSTKAVETRIYRARNWLIDRLGRRGLSDYL